MSDLISRQAAIDAIEARETEQWIESDVDYNNGLESAVAEVNALPSADRPTDGYTEWLEEKILECEPDILCDVVSEENEAWCENNCENMRPECLRKCYEIFKGAKKKGETK